MIDEKRLERIEGLIDNILNTKAEKTNLYLIEKEVTLFMLRMQKKYGIDINKDGLEIRVTHENPYRKEVEDYIEKNF